MDFLVGLLFSPYYTFEVASSSSFSRSLSPLGVGPLLPSLASARAMSLGPLLLISNVFLRYSCSPTLSGLVLITI
ncbi:hypothetical protein KP509_05G085400 [Ceratopteris richardii]|nr:hypothetical protein KP509_05G085400 [Ceratopteris richardii]